MVEEYIPYGHDNAITGKELAKLTGITERKVRDQIAKSKELIINMQDGCGYFRPLPSEAKLVEEWILIFTSRINEEKARIRMGIKWRNQNARIESLS